MTSEEVLAEIKSYEEILSGVLSRFTRDRNGIHIGAEDDPLFRQTIQELIDLFNDAVGLNNYSLRIAHEFDEGISNFGGSPSYKSVENILGTVRASHTRFTRNPELLKRKKAGQSTAIRENLFIIHGRDEAKWRELKDIVKTEFRLKPIVLLEQPDAGCKTVVEKFEFYAQTCAYAIAIFTPDDEVMSGNDAFLQARPNVIYELGWFCGRLGRSGAMLLLKEGTTLFSDFGGIIQKRFIHNVSERILEMKKDLIAAGILDNL